MQNKALRIVNTGKRTTLAGLQALPAGSLFAAAQLPPHTYPCKLYNFAYLRRSTCQSSYFAVPSQEGQSTASAQL